ncbi:hypothetical protein CHARACLAT_009377 [Characodon lateralis]|uniref:Uncharacterized protein n=1 Tax=Characodon lateralis TaxID=208331 RepID=A0ABU7CM62_9TELE|nr:hypothetical protein [Characodon lateralis]
MTVPHKETMDIGQSSTVMACSLKLVLVRFCSVRRCEVHLESETSIFIKLVGEGSMKCSKILQTAELTLDLIKHSGPTPADGMAHIATEGRKLHIGPHQR